SLAVLSDLVPESEPQISSVLALAFAGVPAALLIAWSRRMAQGVILAALGVLTVPLSWSVVAEEESHLLASLEDQRLDACFGALSATAPLDALARRLHGGTAVHMPESAADRVLFLGGGPLFEGHPDRARWVAPFAAARVGARLRREIDFAVVPTLFGHTRQQVEMFARFYRRRFDAAAVVLAVPPWEGEASEAPGAIDWLDGRYSAAEPGFPLLTSWQRRVAEPVTALSTPRALGEAVARLAAALAEDGLPLVVVLPPELDPALAEEVSVAAAERAVTVLTLPLVGDPEAAVEPLADAIAAAMEQKR
ncbi:MAG: hypothetical protein O3B85_12580, partial [Planctomycetota bacterium]|nr:hypothetical protein [Planctomycetota bacterium]